MSNGHILIVLTSHDQLGDTGKPTGFHYEELTTPYQRFIEAGYEVTLASIKGGKPPHDPSSLKEKVDDNPASVCWFLANDGAREALEHTKPVNEAEAQAYDAIYLPGGHGTMWDLPQNEDLSTLISAFYQADKPVAAICHGIAGFVGAKDKTGQPVVKGKRINCFTNEEEKEVGLDETVPFLLESKLRELGAKFESSPAFQAHVAKDANLITGQNPASAEGAANAVLDYLKKSSSHQAA
jgi:putative intracellular protease/amidase